MALFSFTPDRATAYNESHGIAVYGISTHYPKLLKRTCCIQILIESVREQPVRELIFDERTTLMMKYVNEQINESCS